MVSSLSNDDNLLLNYDPYYRLAMVKNRWNVYWKNKYKSLDIYKNCLTNELIPNLMLIWTKNFNSMPFKAFQESLFRVKGKLIPITFECFKK